MTRLKTKVTRIYVSDYEYIMKNRGLDNTPDTIHKMIKQREQLKEIIMEGPP